PAGAPPRGRAQLVTALAAYDRACNNRQRGIIELHGMLMLTLRNLRRIATDPFPPSREDWEGRIINSVGIGGIATFRKRRERMIDPTNYQIAVELADAAVQQAQANVQNVDAQIDVQQAQMNAIQNVPTQLMLA